MQKFEKWDANDSPPSEVNLFVGSSSIAIWTDIQEYFPQNKILNRGFGGSHFSDLLFYVSRVITPYDPAKIFIYEGDNDIAAGEDPGAIFTEAVALRQIIAEIKPGVPVAFISVKPSVARKAYNEQYIKLNEMLRAYADKTENTEFINVWDPVMDENGQVFKHIFLGDSLHMNPEGYKIWKAEISPYLMP